jgi:cation:H+ antiporter
MEILIWSLVFVLSLFVLLKASDYFTDSAEKIGIHFGIPAFIVGVTIVAIGTSLPELVSSIFAVIDGSSEIVIGNVVGSNITNIFLILGISAILSKKLKITFQLIHVDLPFIVGSAFLLGLAIWDGNFTFIEGILFLIGFGVYTFYLVNSEKERKSRKLSIILKEVGFNEKKKLGIKPILTLILSSVLIFFGAKYTIESVIALSELLNIGKELIAVSAVSLGTSLPELFVSINMAKKGKPEMAVGNVLGSNIFNTFAVMGIPAMFGTLIIPASILTLGLPIMIIASILYFFTIQEKEITQWEGWMFLIFYVFFIGKVFSLF